MPLAEPISFLPKKGNYRSLIAYQKAECIYDITFFFANSYLGAKDRTIDQMVQAARSGKQNIAEGCAAASTSAETEIKLINVAKASLQELLTDYEDFLRVRGLEQWALQDDRTRQTQQFCNTHNESAAYMEHIKCCSAETTANIAITLIHQEDVVLRKLLERLQNDFSANGGIREQMTAARLGYRSSQKNEIEHLQAENHRLSSRVQYLEDWLRQLGQQP